MNTRLAELVAKEALTEHLPVWIGPSRGMDGQRTIESCDHVAVGTSKTSWAHIEVTVCRSASGGEYATLVWLYPPAGIVPFGSTDSGGMPLPSIPDVGGIASLSVYPGLEDGWRDARAFIRQQLLVLATIVGRVNPENAT
jgi:hypothetical protein